MRSVTTRTFMRRLPCSCRPTRPQPDRAVLREVEAATPQCRGANDRRRRCVVQRAPRSLGPGRMRRKPQELRLCFNPNRKDPKGIQEGAVDRVRAKQPDSRSTKRAPRPPEKRDRNVVERDTAGKKMAVIRRIATREGTGRRQQPSAFSQRSLAYAHQRLHDVAHHGL